MKIIHIFKAVGKFIISMCQYASDMLNVLFLMKVNAMLDCSQGEITYCPFDVTGLFETIEDLKRAPQIVKVNWQFLLKIQ